MTVIYVVKQNNFTAHNQVKNTLEEVGVTLSKTTIKAVSNKMQTTG